MADGEKTTATTSGPLFELGQTAGTPRALDAMARANVLPSWLLRRHSRGDWGDLDQEDSAANDLAIVNGTRIFSAYVLRQTGVKVWIITEADRSYTTILCPEDY